MSSGLDVKGNLKYFLIFTFTSLSSLCVCSISCWLKNTQFKIDSHCAFFCITLVCIYLFFFQIQAFAYSKLVLKFSFISPAACLRGRICAEDVQKRDEKHDCLTLRKMKFGADVSVSLSYQWRTLLSPKQSLFVCFYVTGWWNLQTPPLFVFHIWLCDMHSGECALGYKIQYVNYCDLLRSW